jgi:hypothetical protein
MAWCFIIEGTLPLLYLFSFHFHELRRFVNSVVPILIAVKFKLQDQYFNCIISMRPCHLDMAVLRQTLVFCGLNMNHVSSQ